MEARGNNGKLLARLYCLFTLSGASSINAGRKIRRLGRHQMVVGIAVAMFVALFAWGANYFGWSDPDGKVQLAMATSFILGIIGGYRAKG
jgi:hypothetical protein